MIFRYDKRHRRVWILGARIHHGLVGVLLVVFGLLLIGEDWHDRWWLSDD